MTADYVALLRGINLGGRNKLPMRDLSAMFVEAGCTAVRTYIQSGNVVFDAPPELAARLPDVIAARIAGEFGYRTPVVQRTAAQMREVVTGNPFLSAGADPATLHVLFLAAPPDPQRTAALDPDRSPPDRFAVRGPDVFLHLPGGAARTKLTNDYFDAKLGTVSTGRNWRTVTTLLDLMSD